MPTPVHVPRVNNNDDTVQIVSLDVKERDFIKRGQILGSVETDKAVVDVEAECDGYVLKIVGRLDEKASVGSVLLWLGETADEPVSEQPPSASAAMAPRGAGQPTAKARAILKELGMEAEQIPVAGERLTVGDIEAWLEKRGRSTQPPGPTVASAAERTPDVRGKYEDLTPEAHGMLTTVLWHRDHAATGYVEIEYDPKPWEAYAAQFAQRHRLMFPPLLPLMAFRLVEVAKATPRINSAIVNRRRYQYAPVNLGFTMQSTKTLYLGVVQEAQDMDAHQFLDALGEVQRHAMSNKLRPHELFGATLAFSSMARWNVSRHVPILPPQTGMIVAHAAPRSSGTAVLGASYDHRLLSGFDAIQVLEALAHPAK